MKLGTTSSKETMHVSILTHGDSGIGKTTSLGTLPEDHTLIACCERSVIPLRGRDFPMVWLQSWADVRGLLASYRNPDAITDDAIRDAVKSRSILAIDSLTELSALCIRDIIDVARPPVNAARKGSSTAPEKTYDELMDMEAWGLYKSRMINIISGFTHLQKHVVMNSLSDWREDKRAMVTNRVPSLSGKLAIESPAYFDLVLHMESQKDTEGNDARVWRTSNSDNIIAKDASGVLAPFETPDYTAILKKICGGQGTATKAKKKAVNV